MSAWTKEVPTKDGYYWTRLPKYFAGSAPCVVLFVGGIMDPYLSDWPSREWAGPIQPPGDAPTKPASLNDVSLVVGDDGKICGYMYQPED